MTGDLSALVGPPLSAPDDVLALITPRLRANADRTAVVDRHGRLSYRDLDRRSAAVAAELRAHGGGPGGVAVHARLGAWAIVAMLGALRAGARYVPIDAAFPPARQRLMHLAGGVRTVLREPGVPDPAAGWSPDAGPDRPGYAYTCFTSGTTGVPKRIDVPVSALAFSTAARLAYYREAVRGFLLCSSISFDSSVAGIYWTLACGGTLIIPSDRPSDLMALTRAAAAERASHLLLVPSLYRMLLAGPLSARLRDLSTVIVAGEPATPALVGQHLAQLPATALFNEYGPTECTVWSTVHRCGPADAESGTVPIGRPIPGCRLEVRDPAGGPVRAGEPGELWIGGPGVATPTAAGWYRTGDLVRVRADGVLEFHGRFDAQLKLGGVRIELGEVEHVLGAQPGVLAAAVGVAGRHSERPALTGFVVPAPDGVDPGRVRAGMLGHLPAAAVPAAIVVVDRLPTQPNGKVDRRALDERAATNP